MLFIVFMVCFAPRTAAVLADTKTLHGRLMGNKTGFQRCTFKQHSERSQDALVDDEGTYSDGD